MLSSYDPLNSTDAITISPASPSTDVGGAAYHGYALGRVRSRSPGPPPGDSPNGDSSDSVVQASVSRLAAASAVARRLAPVDTSEEAVRMPEGPDPEGQPGGASFLAPPIPVTPAPEGAVQSGSEVDEAVFVSAASAAETLQEHTDLASLHPGLFALRPASSRALIAGVATWGARVRRQQSSQGNSHFTAADMATCIHGGVHAQRTARNATMRRSRNSQQLESHAVAQLQNSSSRFAALSASDLPQQSNAADSESGDPASLSPTVYGSAQGIRVCDESDVDGLSSSLDDSPMSEAHDVLNADGTCGRCPTVLCDVRSSGPSASTVLAGSSVTLHVASADPTSVHRPPLQRGPAATLRSTDAESGRHSRLDVGAFASISQATDRSAEEACRAANVPCTPQPSEDGVGPSSASQKLNALMTGTFQPGAAAELHRRTSSEGGGRTHKRHATASPSNMLHTGSGSHVSCAAPDWPSRTFSEDNDRHDLRRSGCMEAGHAPSHMHEPSSIELLEAVRADHPRPQAPVIRVPPNVEHAHHASFGERQASGHTTRMQSRRRGSSPHATSSDGTGTGRHATIPGRGVSSNAVRSSRYAGAHSAGQRESPRMNDGTHSVGESHGADASLIYKSGAGVWLPEEDGSDSDSGQLSAERRRLSALAIRRTVHIDIRRRAAAREALCQTLGSGAQAARSLLVFGAESTPHGISATPRTSKAKDSKLCSFNRIDACCVSNSIATGLGTQDEQKELCILELPLCPQGHRPTLIAQINAQASPQFEQLGPFLFRIGCCKTCRLQVCRLGARCLFLLVVC